MCGQLQEQTRDDAAVRMLQMALHFCRPNTLPWVSESDVSGRSGSSDLDKSRYFETANKWKFCIIPYLFYIPYSRTF
jgi:hypothetical protein